MSIFSRLLGTSLPKRSVTQLAGPTTVINVTKVTPATAALLEVPFKAGIEALLTRPLSPFPPNQRAENGQLLRQIEAWSNNNSGRLVADVHYHPVLAAIHLAFNDHRTLVLSPDILWILIAQGFANHVNANAEELRSQLVKHSGKIRIKVRRDDFVKGAPENPWPEVFEQFTRQIREYIGEATHDFLLPAFSTTGPLERAASQVVLLDAMRSYFEYEMRSVCGIPQIILEGTVADWQVLVDRVRLLSRFGLQWWIEPLVPIVQEFVAAARGQVNTPFWRSIYKLNDESGGPYTTGWIAAWFPYVKDWKTGRVTEKNRWLANGGDALQQLLYPSSEDRSDPLLGLTTEEIPGGIAKAPFLWEAGAESFEMEFLAGFMGVRQDAETLCLRPEIGWAIREAGVEPVLDELVPSGPDNAEDEPW